MTFAPKSPRVGRSPKLKAKWLSNTLAYQYGNNGNKKSEIIVLCNDIDQYLQDIFQSIDTKARGKISSEEFKLLTDVLYLRDLNDTGESGHDLSFSEFHARLCEHFASYGDYTGFLVNQNFRTINVDSNGTSRNGSVATTESSASMCRRKEFQRRMANSKTHNCIHDAAIFKNWDKLRLSGLRLSEMREQIDLMQYEVTFHKEESQSLKEIIEDLRSMLQASDAQNIGLQVALKKCQHKLVSDTDYVYSKSLSRRSLPVEGTKLQYKPLQGEDKSVRILARELNQLRELRDKEINELISFNNQLQHDVTDLSREMCTLEDENRKLKGQLDLITKTYNSCRELFAVCVESFKEVERANSDVFTMELQSKTPSPSPVRTPSLKRKFSFSNARDRKPEIPVTVEADEHLPPEVVLIKRLEHEIEALQETSNTQLQELARLDNDLSNCRRHLQTANFQVEALETECGRLLALEDQLVSVFNLLQKGRSQCLSRKTLGQLLLDVIDSSFGEDEQDMTADQFIRMLQQTLSECPLFLFPT